MPALAASISPRSSRSSGVDERQPQEFVDLLLGLELPSARTLELVFAELVKPCSERLQPRSRAIWRSRTLCAAEPVKWTRYVPALPDRHRHQVELRAADELHRGARAA